MKTFIYNGKVYEVQEKTYTYNGDDFKCLHIKSGNFECAIDGDEMSLDAINTDSDFAALMQYEYLITDYDFLKLIK